MLLGFKTELKINNLERTLLLKHCGVSRHAWNWGLALTKQILEHNFLNPDSKIKFPSEIDLHKYLVALVKSENPWYYECSKSAPQSALRALSTAWKRCFQKVSSQPRFKKKGKNDSFTLEGICRIKDSFTIQVPKIGKLKTYEKLPQIQIKSVTISRQADRWFISFKIDTEIKENQHTSIVGVDLGVKVLATLSTGKVIEGAKSYRRYKAKLSRLQWLNRSKTIGSQNWKRACLKIAKLHRKITNLRKDTIHKLTSLLAKNHGTVVIENLNVSGMMKNHKLAGAIADMGFYELRRQLEYKCQLYGSKLVVVDRWFPSSKTCSSCGHKKEILSLSERVFSCLKCNFKIDRDLNAAINLSMAVS
ncbi:MAG: IS200/IS605 family element transposase accessory protein TnpB [Richelia sp. RM2_1_2]|nr:IS200/IS605 family element transposase accessory protein TnpB [Richelia sp. SM2_1_7]NJM19815.1 IS200/IS605 family element transposase accessory protein TnpB [Richelia sp. SM1_7_0]NJN06877.1 IS200/IS605 family element transposase accessory protein TnpB [Richelia sp. RM1_1_1]NJO30373.1 IS200/IS605 family element transposase accessory protein TnpB [Richelia sp. SL_2_1]NJO57326.1 IS200/IS605 family element transposase accessory protein TnpB [Richelia sp. RM2_1_2]